MFESCSVMKMANKDNAATQCNTLEPKKRSMMFLALRVPKQARILCVYVMRRRNTYFLRLEIKLPCLIEYRSGIKLPFCLTQYLFYGSRL
jgi:hypothetical protein